MSLRPPEWTYANVRHAHYNRALAFDLALMMPRRVERVWDLPLLGRAYFHASDDSEYFEPYPPGVVMHHLLITDSQSKAIAVEFPTAPALLAAKPYLELRVAATKRFFAQAEEDRAQRAAVLAAKQAGYRVDRVGGALMVLRGDLPPEQARAEGMTSWLNATPY